MQLEVIKPQASLITCLRSKQLQSLVTVVVVQVCSCILVARVIKEAEGLMTLSCVDSYLVSLSAC